MKTKLCNRCGQTKPVKDFHLRKEQGVSEKYRSPCKQCIKHAYNQNKDEHRSKAKEYYQKNRDSRLEYYHRNKDYLNRNRRKYFYKSTYGISLDSVEDMREEQEYRCYICGTPETDLTRGLCLDHNHITGQNRKLLCNNCNNLLGHAKENTDILSKAIEYIDEHNDLFSNTTSS